MRRVAVPALRSLRTPVRALSLQEYDSKQLMKRYSVDHQRGVLVTSPSEVIAACAEVRAINPKTDGYIVKSQILAGGRGKGVFADGFKGGVKRAKTPEEAAEFARRMLGNSLTTVQTGGHGVLVRKLMICECLDITAEYYAAFLLDRSCGGPVLIACRDGGVNIEDIARDRPGDIHRLPIAINKGLAAADAAAFATRVFGLAPSASTKAGALLADLYRLAKGCDLTQLEINPLIVSAPKGEPESSARVLCIDAKMAVDDSADFRQAEVFKMRDHAEEDPRETAASAVGLNYIGLTGDVGCLVNGAGLAMATLDVIGAKGGSPANFLDVGGGATASQVQKAFEIIQSDARVKAILVNIFGGIMRCDVIAEGIVAAAKATGLKHPLVVRLAGSHFEEGMKILASSGIKVKTARDLDTAAEAAVAAARG